MKSKSMLSLEEILNFHWEISLGGETLTYEELKALAELKSPLVNVRGKWVTLSAEEINAALDFWKQKGDRVISAREAVKMALGAGDEADGALGIAGVQASGWFSDLLEQLQGSSGFEMLESPEGLQGTLRPYQSRGFSWLEFLRRWGFGACLADDMGLGKTIQTLALVQRAWESCPARERMPTLLICPMSVVGNWQKEAAKFTPGFAGDGSPRSGSVRRGADFKKRAAKHAASCSPRSYLPLLHREVELLRQVSWASLVLDEAQNIQNPQTKQAQVGKRRNSGCAPDRAHRHTGREPRRRFVVDHRVPQPGMAGLAEGVQAEVSIFRFRHCMPIRDATARLKRLTSPFILRRLKTDKTIIADLPEKMEMKVFCNLTKEQVSLYEAVVKNSQKEIESAEGIKRGGVVLATLAKLKQVCNHPAQLLHDKSGIGGRSGKLARLTEMLDEALAAGDRALVFSQFAEMGGMLKKHLQETFGREVLFLHGGTTKRQRDAMVERFQAAGESAPPIFILSLKAGGTGLNLTAASHVFHFDRWWNPAVENQATDRAFRIGQTRRVQVHKFVCAGTLEEKIDAMIEAKQELVGSVIGSGEAWITKLSNAELRELFALRADAFAE